MTVSSELTHRITIQQLTAADDGYGGQTQSWTDFAALFARVEPVYTNWRERDIGGQRDASSGYRVEIRLRTDVTAAMRILWKTHMLAIHTIHEKGEVLSMLTYEDHL